ncbi:desulfoferrodoxin [Pseudodesulfovibrio piezophilus]|uniref:Desulfoferrodoxin n=1 Tax=Pseudodesulfovibrio piezophilus (strain DSM 21447 / JCM 15486 / C1TLV30) TaxID=1322246 RepID=M1WQE6_PSEP2|nr:desulfoferrodoxin [Pseudodesulfovibrio piezophilus]CCH48899.1 Desulfoferrodoxin [Pseudodesulfovibrio piezophilus C1TLV30]
MAIKLGEVYKCNACGNIVMAIHAGGGDLVCCGEEMVLMTENTVDAAVEKHIPVIEKDGDKVTVKVGSTAHPMEEKHYIEWIELCVGDTVLTKILKPGDAPVAEFCVSGLTGDITAREYCNIHGLWAGK